MEHSYELDLAEEERLAATGEPVDVGDALILDVQVLLVLRESDRAATVGRSRFEMSTRAAVADRSHELVAYTKELQLQFTEARELRADDGEAA